MDWNPSEIDDATWRADISNYDAKVRIAAQAATRLGNGDVVGVGSGSTSMLALHAIVELARSNGWHFSAITTSLEMEIACAKLGVRTTSLLQQRPDWSFDGADEIDDDRNMIKGRGGAMLREKLIMTASPDRFVLVDDSKRVRTLGAVAPIPLELVPESLQLVRSHLMEHFDVTALDLRTGAGKDGPVLTENRNLILDAKFSNVANDLDSRLHSIPGVVGTGLFIGFAPTVISS